MGAPEPDAGHLRSDGLQVDEDPVLQDRIWTAQRIAWGGMVLIVLVALAGLTGQGGPLTRRVVETAGVQMSFPRIARSGGRVEEITFRLSQPRGDVVLSLDAGLLDAFQVQAVEPAPRRVRAAGGGLSYLLAGDEARSFVLRLHLRARGAGRAAGVVGLNGAEHPLEIFVLP